MRLSWPEVMSQMLNLYHGPKPFFVHGLLCSWTMSMWPEFDVVSVHVVQFHIGNCHFAARSAVTEDAWQRARTCRLC